MFKSVPWLCLALLLCVTEARAACALCANEGQNGTDPVAGRGVDFDDRAIGVATHAQPLRITIEADLDFARLAVDGGGAAVIDPRAGQRTLDANVADLGGFAYQARIRLTGEPFRAVDITLPDRVRLSGGRAILTDFTTDLGPDPHLDAMGELRFNLGARLEVQPGVSGALDGAIPITADYQ